MLVRSLIELGHNLGLTVSPRVSRTHLEALTAGCDIAQGYHVGYPMRSTLARATQRLREHKVQPWTRTRARAPSLLGPP